MSRTFLLIALFACLVAGRTVHADPIHSRADGSYWHHDSGWVFPEKIAEFARVGFPQDVGGSRDAAAYYARVIDGSRVVASVFVYPSDSAAGVDAVANAGKPLSETPFTVGTASPLSGIRRAYGVDGVKNSYAVKYFITAGEWRVLIHIEGASAHMLPMLDSFALGQRWETLSAAPTPR